MENEEMKTKSGCILQYIYIYMSVCVYIHKYMVI